jgi:hypothetical protein
LFLRIRGELEEKKVKVVGMHLLAMTTSFLCKSNVMFFRNLGAAFFACISLLCMYVNPNRCTKAMATAVFPG